MKIAVAGATGVLGRLVVRELVAVGHAPVEISRASGVDLTTGAGLTDALRGASAVIDVSSTTSTSTQKAVEFFTTVTRHLLASERAADVPHHVTISIVGAAKIDSNYYAGKAAQEKVLTARAGADWSLLRATQFHEFAQQLVSHGRVGPCQVVPTMVSQPIAASEVAAELVAVATGPARGVVEDLAGPHEENMADLVRRYLAANGRRRPVIEVPLPGRWGRGMRDGSLLPDSQARRGRQTFEEWLAARAS